MYKVVNEDGSFWNEYEDFEEAEDVCNELNANLDVCDSQWYVEEEDAYDEEEETEEDDEEENENE